MKDLQNTCSYNHHLNNSVCLNGDLRLLSMTGVVQLCHKQKWRTICAENRWDNHTGNLVCAQLGYNNEGIFRSCTCLITDITIENVM